jgi:hypothetical protein
MNYFTPERYLALQDFTSEEAQNAADAAWEDAVDAYEASLATIRPRLSPSVRELLEGHFLHDAEVLSIGQQEGHFVVVLQLDTPPHDLLTICYELLDEPAIDREALPAAQRSPRPRWLCDELELVDEGGAISCRHSILLSNGWELRLRFRDVRLTLAQSVYPSQAIPLAARSA